MSPYSSSNDASRSAHVFFFPTLDIEVVKIDQTRLYLSSMQLSLCFPRESDRAEVLLPCFFCVHCCFIISLLVVVACSVVVVVPCVCVCVCHWLAKVNLTSTKLDHISLPEELPEVKRRYESFT